MAWDYLTRNSDCPNSTGSPFLTHIFSMIPSTSDSISTWLYNNTDADGLIFIKSVSIEDKSLLELVDLQNRNILDANLKKFISVKKNLKIIGPEIIDLLENAQSWEKIISNLGVVKI